MFKLKTITAKLNMILVITVVLVLSTTTLITYQEYSIKAQKQLDNELLRIMQRLELISPTIIWNLQINLLKDIIKTEALNESIDAIIVKDIDNTIIASTIISKINTNRTNEIIKSEIFFETEKIAEIIIYFNKNKIEIIKNDIIKNFMLKVSISLFLLLFIISYFVNKFIIHNIRILKNNIKDVSTSKRFDNRIEINTNDEIQFLAEEFNKMKDNLDKSWKELNSLNSTLENRVNDEVIKNTEIQKQLFRSEKMVAMGEMIGNIAHQWRQPLSVISTSVTSMVIQKELDVLDDESFKKICTSINTNTQYLSKTIDDFKNFIKGDREKSVFELKDNIDGFLNIIKSSATQNNVNIITNIQNYTKICGYENELTQCIINIYNNAKDAFIENNLENRMLFIDVKRSKNNIKIILQDNAGGIDDTIISKIFEPYFTTKHQSQGTGLGLHMTYNLIVEGMNGNIEAINKEFVYEKQTYKGACFIITLAVR